MAAQLKGVTMDDAAASASLFKPPAPGPGDKDPPVLQQLLKSILRPIEGWPRAVFEERSYRPPIPGMPIMLMDPQAIRTVMVSEAAHFPQGALWRRMMRPVWGEGIVTSEGAQWRWQRQASAPAFRPIHAADLAPIMGRAAQAALSRWKGLGHGARVDISEEAGRITFDVILDTMLSGETDFDRATIRDRIAAFVAQIGKMRLSYFLAPDAFHEERVNRPSKASMALRRDVEAMIRRRREAPPRGDLVDLLMGAADPETGRGMDDATLRDNLLGFIVAGHETSAVALSWSLYLAAAHPATGERIRAEVAAVAGEAPIGRDHVDRLVFTRQVVSEALRLYPPAHTLTRVCTRTLQVGTDTIKAGERVLIPLYALHRHRLWWRDPDSFDPQRFAPDAPAPDRHLYMPFGAGPRICLGAAFAMTELVVLLATLVRGARYAPDPGHRVWPLAGLALRPEGGLPMQVQVESP